MNGSVTVVVCLSLFSNVCTRDWLGVPAFDVGPRLDPSRNSNVGDRMTFRFVPDPRRESVSNRNDSGGLGTTMTVRVPQRVGSAWRELVGPEVTATDTTITVGFAALGALAAPYVTHTWRGRYLGEGLILRLMASDLWGGAWVNNTKACARWYERPGQSDVDHLKFAAMHLHPMVLVWMDRRSESRRVPGWLWAGAHYSYLIAATLAIRWAPRHRRWLGPALTLGGVALGTALGSSPAAPWFAPVYYTKLLLGHASAALWSDDALTADR